MQSNSCSAKNEEDVGWRQVRSAREVPDHIPVKESTENYKMTGKTVHTAARNCINYKGISGSLRTEPGTGEPADLELEPAEPDTEPEPAEPEPEKMKNLANPQKAKKVQKSIQNQKITPPTIQNQRITSPHPAKKRGLGPLGAPGVPLLVLAGWGDVIL